MTRRTPVYNLPESEEDKQRSATAETTFEGGIMMQKRWMAVPAACLLTMALLAGCRTTTPTPTTTPKATVMVTTAPTPMATVKPAATQAPAVTPQPTVAASPAGTGAGAPTGTAMASPKP